MRNLSACTLLTGLVMTSPALAQEITTTTAASTDTAAAQRPAEAPPPPKRLVVASGVDFASAYMFRGIYQEDRGAITPAFVDVGVSIGPGLSLNVGHWSSLHSGPSGHGGRGNAWYEADYYGSATFTFGNVQPGVLFTSYTSPNDGFATVQEIAAVLAYDDGGNVVAFSPRATVGFELGAGQADGGSSRGTYLELAIKPALKPASALTMYLPVKTGLSLRNYYEGPTGSDRFGYFSAGVIGSVPLLFMGAPWEAHAGVDLMWLGDNMALLNSGNHFKPVIVIGMSFTY